MKTIYIARLKENEPCLVKAQFVQDTRKAIYVENGTAEVILGGKLWFTIRADKKGCAWFNTKQEALEWLEGQLARSLEQYKRQVEHIGNHLLHIKSMRNTND